MGEAYIIFQACLKMKPAQHDKYLHHQPSRDWKNLKI